MYICTFSERESVCVREKEREIESKWVRERESERESKREREREKERKKEKESEREKERVRERWERGYVIKNESERHKIECQKIEWLLYLKIPFIIIMLKKQYFSTFLIRPPLFMFFWHSILLSMMINKTKMLQVILMEIKLVQQDGDESLIFVFVTFSHFVVL